MVLFKTYKDLELEAEGLEDQISIIKHELYVWYGIDLDKEVALPGGKFAHKYGMNAAIIQIDKRVRSLRIVKRDLEQVQYRMERLEKYMKQFEKLEYKIAYKRLVEGKTHE